MLIISQRLQRSFDACRVMRSTDPLCMPRCLQQNKLSRRAPNLFGPGKQIHTVQNSRVAIRIIVPAHCRSVSGAKESTPGKAALLPSNGLGSAPYSESQPSVLFPFVLCSYASHRVCGSRCITSYILKKPYLTIPDDCTLWPVICSTQLCTSLHYFRS